MIKITLEQSFDFYLGSLERCGVHLFKMSDKEVENQIFEEFTTEYPGSLSRAMLERLEDNGIISEEIAELSQELQTGLLLLNGTEMWNVESLRTELGWKEILFLSDRIKELIHQRWSDEEIAILRKTQW